MADYWKSTAKYHCKYCDITINDDAPSRSQHENGLKHKGNKDRFIRSIYKRSEQNQRDKAFEQRELRRLEGIGGAASAKETATGLKSGTGTSTAAASKKPQASRDPYANYSTAKSLGYEDPGETQERSVGQEGSVGGWEVVAEDASSSKEPSKPPKRASSPPPPPPPHDSTDLNATKTAASGSIYIPGKTDSTDTSEIKFKKRKTKK